MLPYLIRTLIFVTSGSHRRQSAPCKLSNIVSYRSLPCETNKSFDFFYYFSFTKYRSCIIDIFCELSMYLLLNCNILVFIVTQKLAKWVESQIQGAWKEIYLNRLFRLTFNINSQLINNLLWRFMILFQYPTLILEQNVVTRTRIFESLNPYSSK